MFMTFFPLLIASIVHAQPYWLRSSGDGGNTGGCAVGDQNVCVAASAGNCKDTCMRGDSGTCVPKPLVTVYYTKTITYYVTQCPQLESFSICYDSYTQNAVTSGTFTITYTAYGTALQSTKKFSFDYTSFVTGSSMTYDYIDYFTIPVSQAPVVESRTLTLTKFSSQRPRMVYISATYTLQINSDVRNAEEQSLSYTNFLVYQPEQRSYTKTYHNLVSRSPSMKYFYYTYASMSTTAPQSMIIFRSYTIYFTRAPTKKTEYFRYKGQIPSDVAEKSIIKTYSFYVTSAPVLITHTEKFTYSVPKQPEMIVETIKFEKYITSPPQLKSLALEYTRYPIVPLRMKSIDLTITYYVTSQPVVEIFTEMQTFFSYRQPLRSSETFIVSDWVAGDGSFTSFMDTYTSYVSRDPVEGMYYVTIPTYVYGDPMERYLVRTFTSYKYPPLQMVDFTINYTSYVTQSPVMKSENIIHTMRVESGLTKEEQIHSYTSHQTCAPVTRCVIISYTTFCNCD